MKEEYDSYKTWVGLMVGFGLGIALWGFMFALLLLLY